MDIVRQENGMVGITFSTGKTFMLSRSTSDETLEAIDAQETLIEEKLAIEGHTNHREAMKVIKSIIKGTFESE